MTDHRPTQAQREAAYSFMIKRWPDAHSLRWEGKCPSRSCRKYTLWSGQLEGDGNPERRMIGRNGVEEPCVYFCDSCRWSNGGSRSVENDELEGDT